jgi:hypothetical protein
MKIYVEIHILLLACLNLDGGQCSALRSGCFTLDKNKLQIPFGQKVRGGTAGLDARGEGKYRLPLLIVLAIWKSTRFRPSES